MLTCLVNATLGSADEDDVLYKLDRLDADYKMSHSHSLNDSEKVPRTYRYLRSSGALIDSTRFSSRTVCQRLSEVTALILPLGMIFRSDIGFHFLTLPTPPASMADA